MRAWVCDDDIMRYGFGVGGVGYGQFTFEGEGCNHHGHQQRAGKDESYPQALHGTGSGHFSSLSSEATRRGRMVRVSLRTMSSGVGISHPYNTAIRNDLFTKPSVNLSFQHMSQGRQYL